MASVSRNLTPKQLAHMLDEIEKLEAIFKAVKEHAVARVHAGDDIPGYEADFTAPRRAWGDEEEALCSLRKLGLTQNEASPRSVLSPAEAEKALRKAGKWPKKPRGSAAADFVNPLQGLLADKTGNPTIKRKTD